MAKADEEVAKQRSIHESNTPSDISTGEVLDVVDKRYGRTHRGLSNRHVQLMAIGGSIGTGLFVGIGSSLRTAGPLSVFLAYIVYPTIFIWPCNMAVAEMATHLPIRGSIYEFASRYVDPAFGFALGWTYFYGSAMLFCAELSAVATVMGYWSDVNPAAWVAMALVVCILLNVFAVKFYGESEFIFACTKILLIVGLCMLTFITMVGGNPQHDAYGFRTWTHGNAMHEYLSTGPTGRFCGWWSVMLYAAFSISGPDLIALGAGEMKNPRRNIPRCARAVFYRIVGFYVLGVLGVGIICSSRDPRLLGALSSGSVGSAASPWVIGITNLGISNLASLVNALILLSGWSCGNAYLYSSSRTLYSLAIDGQAPKLFLRCTASGVPIYAVAVVSLISCITFLMADTSAATVFGWFVDLATCAFLISYTSMLVTYAGWFRALKAQGVDRNTLHWKAPLMPYAAYIAIGVGCTIIFFLGFDVFSPFEVEGFVTGYFGVAWAGACFVFWKVLKRTKFVNPKRADLWAGKAAVDAECRVWEEEGGQGEDKERGKGGLVARWWDKLW